MHNLQKSVIILAAALLMCGGNLCIRASRQDGKILYISVTATFLIEVFKFLTCFVFFLYYKPYAFGSFAYDKIIFYSVPAFLYTIDNNLTYLILRFVDPATVSVLWNLKIITTAILLRFVMKRILSEIQYIAIVLLVLGTITSESDHITHAKDILRDSTSAAVAKAALDRNNELFGFMLIGIGVFISSFAGVFTEWTLKSDRNRSLIVQSLQLYMAGIIFNLLGLLVEKEVIVEHGFFQGYNYWTWAAILIHTISGVTTGVMLKYLDNIACIYSHALSMLLTMVFSMLFFQFSPSLEFFCGFCIVLISMYLYHFKSDAHEKYLDDEPLHERIPDLSQDKIDQKPKLNSLFQQCNRLPICFKERNKSYESITGKHDATDTESHEENKR